MAKGAVVPLRPKVVLGGSSAAAACGVDPYRSPVALWAELTGRLPREEPEATRWGARLEPVIVDALRDEYAAVTTEPGWAETDPDRPWLVGHPDGTVETVAGTALLEVKTASHWPHVHGGPVPIQYDAQIQVYLHLTGLDRALLACLVAGQRLVTAEVRRRDKTIGMILAGMERFLGYVQRDEPPPPDETDSTRHTLTALYPEQEAGKRVRLLGEDWQTFRELRDLRDARDRLDAQIQARENTLKALMGDAETALSPTDAEVIAWKAVRSHRIDTKALREQRPHIADLFTVATLQRRFTLK